MRLFATERIAGLMDRMGFKEGDMLEHNMLNKSVENAQKRWKKTTSVFVNVCWNTTT